MSRTKVLISILTVLILIVLSGVSVWAAPRGQEPSLEPTEEPTVEPTEEPTAEPTEEPTVEPTEEPTAEPTEEPTVEPTEEPTAEPTEEPTPMPTLHPVASALAEFFAEKLGLDYDTIMGYHEDGMGFGVIAQACWMSYALEGDAELLGDILEAKKSGDFSTITLPDGGTAKNWGQFKKAVLGSDKAKKNLGAIMSGRAAGEQEQEEEEVVGSSTELPGKGKDKGGKPDTPPGKVKDKDKGGGPPAEPPGKGKDKDKGGGKDKGK